MLFNSYIFLLVFLPATLLVYQLVSRFHRRAVVVWLGLASLIFYGYWKPAFLLVLGTSILANFLFSNLISRRIPNGVGSGVWLWLAIAANLGALCWFKYLFPMLNFGSAMVHSGRHWENVVLPLGISFFTFTQIAYLVDLQQGAAEQQDFFSYLLFVTFFPHLIAGPILHHKDIMPQFQQNRSYGLHYNDVAVGFSWFAMGLFKKSLLADNLAPFAHMTIDSHGAVSPTTAWIGALAYTLQLYFDFSGYCDMAGGLARMFSIDFPLNFSSPYKAASVIEFWQRWHITLSQYINSYVYSPIQFWVSRRRQEQGKKVSRKAQATVEGFLQMVLMPTMVTMFLAGIWHGAGLQFLVYGLVHGAYLTVNHGWRAYRHKIGAKPLEGNAAAIVRVGRVLFTFLCVVVSFMFFRAASATEGWVYLTRMAGHHAPVTQALAPLTQRTKALLLIVAGLIIVWGFPNTQQILARYKPALNLAPTDEQPAMVRLHWEPNALWAVALGGVVFASLVVLQNPSTFLYFQF